MQYIITDVNPSIPDENNAMDFFRSIRWANGVYCPKCKSFKIQKKRNA